LATISGIVASLAGGGGSHEDSLNVAFPLLI
jgi:hypothetical protein